MRMQERYLQQQQQAGFGHQEEMLGKEQAFQREQTQTALKAHGAIAQAEMAQKEKLAGQHETESTKRTGMIVAGRLGVQDLKNQTANEKAKQPKPWQVKNVNTVDTSKGYPVTTSKALLFNPNNNALYAPAGDKLIRWDSDKNAPAVPPGALNRNVDPSELQALYSAPNDTVPKGYKNAGMTNLEAFEATHHYIPAGLGSHLTKGGMAGSEAQAPEAMGNSELEDQQDQATAEGNDPYGRTGSPTSQPDDFAQAQ